MTIIASRDARIFAVEKQVGDGSVDLVYGCLYRTGRRWELSRAVFDGYYEIGDAVIQPRLLGPRVAFVLDAIDDPRSKYTGTNPADRLRIVDLRSGRRVRDDLAGDDSTVTDWDATRRGVVAWIERPNHWYGAGFPPTYVHKHDARGRRLLDSGTDIPGKSLVLAGSMLYWIASSQVRSAPLHQGS